MYKILRTLSDKLTRKEYDFEHEKNEFYENIFLDVDNKTICEFLKIINQYHKCNIENDFSAKTIGNIEKEIRELMLDIREQIHDEYKDKK